ncbi:MAG: hypothetical protein AB7T27_02040 [Kiritimatiellia bacterium]
MKLAKTIASIMVCVWLYPGIQAVGQDDLNIDALLDDLTGDPSVTSEAASVEAPAEAVEEAVLEEAPVVEELPAAVEPVVEEIPAEVPAEADLFVEETAVVAEEAVEISAEAVPSEDAALDEFLAEEPSFEAEAPVEEALPAVVEEPVFEEQAPAEEMIAEPMAEEAMPLFEEAPVAEEMPVAEEASFFEEEPAAEETFPAEEMMAEEPAVEEAEAPAEVAEPVVDKKTAKLIAQQEEVRRQANETTALQAIDDGFKALDRNDFSGAAKLFEDAASKLPERPATRQNREHAIWGLVEASYREARDLSKDPAQLDAAMKSVDRALKWDPAHKPAGRLKSKITRAQERKAIAGSRPVPLEDRPEIIEQNKTVAQLVAEGKQFYDIGDYKSAEAMFDQVLIEDEFNTDAMRYLRNIEDHWYRVSTLERKATVAESMRKVREKWNPPTGEVELPTAVVKQESIDTKTTTEKLREKMSDIMIPSIEFRQANIRDVVNFLVEASVAGDPEGMGVNIILNLNQPGETSSPAPAPAPVADDPFADFGGGDLGGGFEEQPSDFGGGSSIPTITLNLRRISLIDALKIITEVSNLRYRIDGNVVIITPAGVATGVIVTRMYPVQPSIIDVIVERGEDDSDKGGEFVEMTGSGVTMTRGDVKKFFTDAGVPFPTGTSITYNPSISQMIVANTAENLEIFERILAQLNVIPSQVEIEARFVEIGQNDLEELGLEWILTDDYEIAHKEGLAPIAGQERIQMDANQSGLTQGLRFFGFDGNTGALAPASAITRGTSTAMGNILSFSSVLTNPEMQMVLHALQQKGGSDLLSAPRITTRSGVNAQIQVVQEIIYPTEFESEVITIDREVAGGGTIQERLVTVTPGSFETRETGVILNVTPTVGPDGYTIDLTLVPEVSELVDWIQYGSVIDTDENGNPVGYNIPQPIFSSRNVTTSIVVWDGATVVMGGLIREEMVTMEDKIPVLGDIPLLGALFRSKGEMSQKRNLLIFVTARLVDPAGKPIHKADAMAMPGGSASLDETAMK